MSSRLTYSSSDMNPSVFRYWQSLPPELLELLWLRTPLGNLLCEGAIRDAFSPGFDIMQGDKEHPRNEEILKDRAFNDRLEKIIKAIAAKRAFGFSILIKFSFSGSGSGSPSEPVLYWLTHSNITQMEVKEGTREITALEFTPPTKQYQSTSGTGVFSPVKLSASQLEDVQLLANYTSEMGVYRSYLEPIADQVISLLNVDQQISLLMIRIGSGIKVIKAPWAVLSDTSKRSSLEGAIRNMGMNSALLVPNDEGTTDIELVFGTGSSINNKEIRDILLESISAYSGFPREYLLGSELGLKSSETNRQRTLNLMSKTEAEEEENIMWMLNRFYDIDLEGDVWLRWKPLVEVDEADQVAVLASKFDIITKLAPEFERLGIDQEELYKLLNIDLKIDRSMIAKFEEFRDTLINSTTQNNTDNEDPNQEDSGEGPPSNNEGSASASGQQNQDSQAG